MVVVVVEVAVVVAAIDAYWYSSSCGWTIDGSLNCDSIVVAVASSSCVAKVAFVIPDVGAEIYVLLVGIAVIA